MNRHRTTIQGDPHMRVARIHKLFNELHKELYELQEDSTYPDIFFNRADEVQDLARKVDALHHDFSNAMLDIPMTDICVACGKATNHKPGGYDCPPQ
jgi:hypothetical protein